MFRVITTEEVLKLLDQYNWVEFHLHHTWKPTHRSFNGSNHIAIQQGMYNHHVNTNKWDNIAQHLTLMPDGTWVTGRPMNQMPISIYGKNKVGALMVEMVGNFDIEGSPGAAYNNLGYDKLEGDQKVSILTVIKYFVDRKKPLILHNEHANKTCPGTSIIKSKLLQEAIQLSNPTKEEAKTVEGDNKPIEVPKWAEEAWEWSKVSGINDGKVDSMEEIRTMCYLYRFYQLLKSKGLVN